MKKPHVFKKGVVTKTKGANPKDTNLVVNELRIVSADTGIKNIGNFINARASAISIWNPNRVLLYDLYDDISLDGHLTGIINKRFDAVLNKELHFVDSKGKRLEDFDTLIESLKFRDLKRKILETPLWGVSGMEYIPGECFDWKEIPRKHIKIEKGIITKEQYGVEGIDYSELSNVMVLGNERDLGLLLKCSPYAIYKRGNIGDWAQYVEIFGQPVRIIKYDAWDQKTKMELKEVMDESGSSLAIMIPKQADFEMKDGKQSNGDGQLQERFKIALDNEMSILILGNTETTTSSRSSGHAQSIEHSKQQLEITKSDMKYLIGILNSEEFLAILRSYGLPVEGGKFLFEKELDIDNLVKRQTIDEFVSQKVPIADDYWYDTYGIPKP